MALRHSVRLGAGLLVLLGIADPARATAPVAGNGSMTVNPTPVAPPPLPLPRPGTPAVASASATPLAGPVSNGIASPLTAAEGGSCCPCRTVRRVVHHRVVRHVARAPVYAALPPPPLVPLYPVIPYRPVWIARPIVVAPPPFAYGRPYYPVLRRPFFYGPRRFWRVYDRPGW